MHPGRFIGFWLLVVMMTGCAGYKLGPTGGYTHGMRSMQINMVQNETMEPRLSEAVTTALRKRVQQDGTFELNTSNDGDFIVTTVITQFERDALSYQPTDVVTMRDAILKITALITITERGTDRVIMKREVTGRSTLRIGKNEGAAERQAIPLIADDLALRAMTFLVDGPIK